MYINIFILAFCLLQLYALKKIVCMCEYQPICNPEERHKCRSNRELPSVSVLLTSNVALTIFLMHNYPDTLSRRVFFSNEVASVTRLVPDLEADYKIGLTHIPASGNPPKSRRLVNAELFPLRRG